MMIKKLSFLAVLLLFSLFALGGAERDPATAQAVVEKHNGHREPILEPVYEAEAQVMPWAEKIENCIVTYYDTCKSCCGKTDGITYSGTEAVPYETCAVDPVVIPLGSTVMVDFGDGLIQVYRAEDVGGGVRGNRIDICVSSHEEATRLGVKEATVYWNEALWEE